MSMNETPSGSRIQIGIFGCRNAGKSSLINALTGQALAVVSDTPGTTTDPVAKAMELLPLGPVVLIDTPGIDDTGALGELRIGKSREILRRVDMAILAVEGKRQITGPDQELEKEFGRLGIPYLVVFTHGDEVSAEERGSGFWVSSRTGENIQELKEKLAGLKTPETARPLVSDLVSAGDIAVLVVPVDSSAPKGRLILPQQQVIRELLDCGASALVTGVEDLAGTLAKLQQPPRIVITDSQVFGRVAQVVPHEIAMTSFSILFARSKGNLVQAVTGARLLKALQTGDKVLISEGCTHHRQCEDIGTVKLPRWIRQFTDAEPVFEFSSGQTFPEDLRAYKLVIHCGGCTLNPREMRYRLQLAAEQGVPMTNYGIAIASIHGILDRAVAPLGL